MTTTGGSALTTTVGVVNGVHRNTTHSWANTAPARSTRFTQLAKAVL
jgi:hypothetical protein